jgi:hypothetical protein
VCVQDPVLLQTLAEPLTAAAEAHNQLQVERLLQLCQEGAQMQQQAEQTASQLKDLYYELTAQLREVHTQEVRLCQTYRAACFGHRNSCLCWFSTVC